MRITKILAPVVGVLLFATPAFAQLSDDYGIAAAGTYCPTLSVTIQRGARDITTNSQVSELQKFLADYYDIDPNEIVKGYFGRITQGYVIQFQKEQGLPTFGIAGSLTRAAIARVCKSTPSVQSGTNNNNPNANLANTTTYVPPTIGNSNSNTPNTATTIPESNTITASQSSTTPICSLLVTTTRGSYTISNTSAVSGSAATERIMILNDEPLNLKWSSPNAKQGYDYTGQTISGSGSAVIQPPQVNRSYQYQFDNYKGNTFCTALVYPASGGIDQGSLNTSSPNPTISGVATGVSSVEVVVRMNTFTSVRLYDNTSVPVVNGRWSTTINPALPSGSYMVDVYGPSDLKLNYLVSGALTVGVQQASATIDQSSLTQVTGNPLISGSATGLNSVTVLVASKVTGGGGSWTSIPVVNGRWSAVINSNVFPTTYGLFTIFLNSNVIPYLSNGQYGVDVYAGEVNISPLLTSGTMSVNTPPTCTLTATSPYDATGKQIPVTLTWTSTNANYVTMRYRWAQNTTWTPMSSVSWAGSTVVTPTDSTIYSQTFTGSGGSKECVVTVGLKG